MKPDFLIATNMLGLGPKPGEIADCKSGPKSWVLDQIDRPGRLTAEYRSAPGTMDMIVNARKIRNKRRKASPLSRKKKIKYGFISDQLQADINLRHAQAVTTKTSFVERWTRFWVNHFTVSARNNFLKMATGSFEREAIRPNVFGRFDELLTASTLHPAMLYYLDNSQSIGPNSRIGRRRKGSFNENLAREVLELHTLGVDGGYQLQDIQALSKALTGWRHVGLPKSPEKMFFLDRHEPGPTSLLGVTYEDSGQDQITAVLKDLAVHPATARFIATRLATHFIGDGPLERVVEKLAQCFLDGDGDLKILARYLVNMDEVWKQKKWVFKSPEDYLVSVGRAMPGWDEHFYHSIPKLLGQPAMMPPGPDGWELTGENWINAENIIIRLGWFRRNIATVPKKIDARFFAQEALGNHISRQTASVMKRASSREASLVFGLMSPEFLRR